MELTTIAKPYANAVFEITQQNSSYSDWKAVLEVGASITENAMIRDFIASPNSSKVKKVEAIAAVFASALSRVLSKQETAFVNLLLDNGRMNALPNILELFDAKSSLSSDAKVFEVISAYQLSAMEEKKIIGDLSDKYNTAVSIETSVNENLLGGVVIKEGDKVIDLSVKARANKLGSCLSIN